MHAIPKEIRAIKSDREGEKKFAHRMQIFSFLCYEI